MSTTEAAEPEQTFTLADLRRVMNEHALKWDVSELRAEREYDRRLEEEDPDMDPLYRLPRGLSRRDKARTLANLTGAYEFDATVDSTTPITDEELVSILRPPARVDTPPAVAPAPAAWKPRTTAPAGAAAYHRDDPRNPFRVPLERGGTPAPSSGSGYSPDDPRNPWRQPSEGHAGDAADLNQS